MRCTLEGENCAGKNPSLETLVGHRKLGHIYLCAITFFVARLCQTKYSKAISIQIVGDCCNGFNDIRNIFKNFPTIPLNGQLEPYTALHRVYVFLCLRDNRSNKLRKCTFPLMKLLTEVSEQCITIKFTVLTPFTLQIEASKWTCGRLDWRTLIRSWSAKSTSPMNGIAYRQRCDWVMSRSTCINWRTIIRSWLKTSWRASSRLRRWKSELHFESNFYNN